MAAFRTQLWQCWTSFLEDTTWRTGASCYHAVRIRSTICSWFPAAETHRLVYSLHFLSANTEYKPISNSNSTNSPMEHAAYLLNIWEFVYFVWDLSPPKRRVVRRRILLTDAYRTCAGHVLGFMSIKVTRRYENNFFQICVHVHVGLDFCCGEPSQATGRSVGPYAVGLYQATAATCGPSG